MSNVVLTQIAYKKAQELMEEVIKQYNNIELTLEGKREVLLNSLAFSFMGGYNLFQDDKELIKMYDSSLKQQTEQYKELWEENQELKRLLNIVIAEYKNKSGSRVALQVEEKLKEILGDTKISTNNSNQFLLNQIEEKREQNRILIDKLESKEEALRIAVDLIEMVADHSKMPHKHNDTQTRLYCLTERAVEALAKITELTKDKK